MQPAPWKRPLDYYLLWLVVIASVGVNAYLVNVLLEARRQAGEAAAAAARAVAELEGASIDYPIEVRDTVPISLTIRHNEVFTVPISYTLPINTQVSVPLRTPLGTFPINVPVFANVPINLSPVVPISLAVPISLTVPIAVDVPIHVELADTALGEALASAEQYLLDLAASLGYVPGAAPPAPPGTPTPE